MHGSFAEETRDRFVWSFASLPCSTPDAPDKRGHEDLADDKQEQQEQRVRHLHSTTRYIVSMQHAIRPQAAHQSGTSGSEPRFGTDGLSREASKEKCSID